MIYDQDEKVYFAIESITTQLEELNVDINSDESKDHYKEAMFNLSCISSTAYQNCEKRDQEKLDEIHDKVLREH